MKNVISGVLEASAGKWLFHYFRSSIKVAWNSEPLVLSQTFLYQYLSISFIDLISNSLHFKRTDIPGDGSPSDHYTASYKSIRFSKCFRHSYIISCNSKIYLDLIKILEYIELAFVSISCKFSWPEMSSWIFFLAQLSRPLWVQWNYSLISYINKLSDIVPVMVLHHDKKFSFLLQCHLHSIEEKGCILFFPVVRKN